MRGDAEDVYAAGGVLDDEERIQPAQGDGVEEKQVAGQDRIGLRPQKLAPRRSGAVRCGVDAGGMQNLPNRGGADLVAEAGELAVDASIFPCRILGGRAEDQGAQAGGDGRSPGPCRLGGPAAGDQLAMPAQDGGGVTSSPRRRRTGSSRVRAVSRARSVQLIRELGVRRRSTPSWWRRTRILMSLVVSGCRIGYAERSSSGAWRTSGRSAAAPPADHAWCPARRTSRSQAVCAVSGTHNARASIITPQ
jgi:hypothetical protein